MGTMGGEDGRGRKMEKRVEGRKGNGKGENVVKAGDNVCL